ncbi:Clp protease N-terminal domain-containing protein [Conexibacter sp. SYSU D00693]|uniref:Clp protease N-terminal domain-containing protein n=1 Tax=Conexibacter sp. SYSU D00693 TaxID=2812560 RepID=UPI00196B3CAF|nr:Clp protease N-terminal domain-containing protein [Conexibacter sp. SYSU D00693]
MFERFTKDAKGVVLTALEEARREGATRTEAEHLLLALATRSGGRAQELLAAQGLDEAGVREALRAEEERSLAAVGIAPPELPEPRPALKHPRTGTSAKVALERSLKAATRQRTKRLGPEHVLLGLLEAEGGRVPRALAHAGVDREALAAAAGT